MPTPARASMCAALLPRPPHPTRATCDSASLARVAASSFTGMGGLHERASSVTLAPRDGREYAKAIAVAERGVLGGVTPVHEDDARLVGQPEHSDDVGYRRSVPQLERARVATAAPVGLEGGEVCEERDVDVHMPKNSAPRAAVRGTGRGWRLPGYYEIPICAAVSGTKS